MKIQIITSEYFGSHSYILIEQGHVIVIDVGDADKVIHEILREHHEVDYCVLTHEHCDHILGCSRFREQFNCKVYASSKCDNNMRNSKYNFSQYYNAFIILQTKEIIEKQKKINPFTTYADIVFSEEKTLDWMGHKLYLRETPGHSQGSICILVDNEYLFSGDTLLKDDGTGVRFVGSDKEQLLRITYPWLKSLDQSIKVYPGHGEYFILGERLTKPII